jgi:hypothetical protein
MTASYPVLHATDAFKAAGGFAPRHRGGTGWPDYGSLDLPVSSVTAATTLWFKHPILLGTREDAAHVVEALAKIRANADELRGL